MKTLFNFIWFLIKLIHYKSTKGNPLVDKKTYNERLTACYNCEKLNKVGLLTKIKGPRCGICGCFVHEKTKYAFEECPDKQQKWTMKIF